MPTSDFKEPALQIEGLSKLKIFNDYLEYKKRLIKFKEIKSTQFTATATKHSISFVPTGTSYESDLFLILVDGQRVRIKQESSFWGGKSEKEHSEAVWQASEIISITTFNSRVERYELEFKEKGFLKTDEFHITKNCDLFKNRNLIFNLRDEDVTVSLGPFQIFVSRARKGLGRLLGAKEYVIPIDIDRDCILYILKHYLHYSFTNTHVREKTIDQRKLFFHAILRLSAKIAKADGHVSPEEINIVKEYFDIDKAGIKDAGDIFNQSVNNNERVEDIAKEIFSALGNKHELLEYVVIGLLRIASADGVFHQAEIELIEKVADTFGFTKNEKWAYFAMFGIGAEAEDKEKGATGSSFAYGASTKEERYFRILNLEHGATIEDIKSAYRRLARKHHPDVLYAKGIPIDEIRESEEVLKTINEAYSYLTRG